MPAAASDWTIATRALGRGGTKSERLESVQNCASRCRWSGLEVEQPHRGSRLSRDAGDASHRVADDGQGAVEILVVVEHTKTEARRLGEAVLLVTREVNTSPLGTRTSRPSYVRMCVARTSIRSTVPSMVPDDDLVVDRRRCGT